MKTNYPKYHKGCSGQFYRLYALGLNYKCNECGFTANAIEIKKYIRPRNVIEHFSARHCQMLWADFGRNIYHFRFMKTYKTWKLLKKDIYLNR